MSDVGQAKPEPLEMHLRESGPRSEMMVSLRKRIKNLSKICAFSVFKYPTGDQIVLRFGRGCETPAGFRAANILNFGLSWIAANLNQIGCNPL